MDLVYLAAARRIRCLVERRLVYLAVACIELQWRRLVDTGAKNSNGIERYPRLFRTQSRNDFSWLSRVDLRACSRKSDTAETVRIGNAELDSDDT